MAPAATAMGGSPRRWRSAAPVAVALVALAGFAALNITVVPDSAVSSTDLAGNPTFVPAAYVDSLWASRVLPLVHDKATDVATVLPALAADADAAGERYGHRPKAGDGPWNFVVKGAGAIASADIKARHATVTVDVGGGQTVVLQIGPVIFGTALRDSLPFVSFDQVVNQIQFAQVSRELNDRATAAARSGLDVAALVPGAHVSFAGAMSATNPPQVTVIDLRVMP